LRLQFDSLSTLAQNRKDPANAAQIDRRAREDAELLAELLRARGFYDAWSAPGWRRRRRAAR
jgi:translocation and assembly module TamA